MPGRSIAKTVEERLKREPGRLFTFADFDDLPATAVAPALSRLVKHGSIRRARKGVYYAPRNTALGEVPADPIATSAKIGGRTAAPAGISAASALGLTTHVPAVAEFAIENRRRTPPPGVAFRPRTGTRRAGLDPHDIAVFEVLRDLKRLADVPDAVVETKLTRTFSDSATRTRLLRAVVGEPPRVRAMVGALAESAGAAPAELRSLRRGLNPTSRFDFGPLSGLLTASSWGARKRAA